MNKYTNQIKKINGSEVVSPPQSVELEEIVLGALMLDKDLVNNIIDVLTVKDFYKPQNQVIFKTMVDLFNKHEAIDVLTVTNLLKIQGDFEKAGGATHLTFLVSKVPATFYIDEYLRIIKTKSKLRALLKASYTIGRYALDETQDVDVILDLCEKEVFQISKESVGDNFTSVSQELDKAFERIDMLKNSDESLRGISTGFDCLDNLLGGLQKSDMVVLGARPSVGKTSLALDIARRSAVKTKKPIALFSLEMSKDQLVDRLLAAQSGIDLWKIRTGKLRDNDFTNLRDTMEILSKAPIYIDDAPGLSMLKIRTKSRRLMSEHGLGMIVIDYLQLILPTVQTPNTVQQFSDISRQIKGLARELDVPVLVLSQLSRNVEQRGSNAKPKLSDLRETGCLTGDTKILNAETGEFYTMKYLAERKNQDSFMVYTIDDNYKVIKKPLIKAFYSGQKQTYELVLRSGRKIKASGNHPFRKIEGWTALDDLQIGDKIVVWDREKGGDIYWDEIMEINKLKIEDVYDATIKDTHNFLANDIIVHNSIEQDADVVMLLNRKISDVQTPDGENNFYVCVNVAKHRNGPIGERDLFFVKETASFAEVDKTRGELDPDDIPEMGPEELG